jgi:hAT family C-terminal dimerisation region/Hermes transposase DNA-binding domain
MKNSKSIFSEPSAIISAKGVDISQTYGHLYELNPDNGDEFRCKICLRVASLLKSSNEPKALEAITNLTAFLNCKSRSHIVAHLAIKHPEHLVEDFPANCKAHLIRKALHKDEVAPVPSVGINQFLHPPVVLDKLDLTLWLLEDMRPFSIVEGAGFKKMIETLNKGLKNYKTKIPSADTIAREAALVDEALQDVLRVEIPSKVGHSEIVGSIIPDDTPFTLLSFTLDAWTSISGRPFLGVTMHYITKDFEMKSHAMALRHFPPPHTSEQYMKLFDAILDEYGLASYTALSVTTDSASVMLKMMDKSDLPNSRCMSHCINLAIQADTFEKKQFKNLVECVVKLTGYFTSVATTRNHIVEMAAREKGIELVKAVQMVVTRWSSIYYMLKAHLKRLPIISALSGNALHITPLAKEKEYDRTLQLCISNQSLHIAIVEILEPITKWSALLQSSTLPTISLVFEARSDILAHLQPVATDAVTTRQFRAHLKVAFQKRFDDYFVPVNLPAQLPQSNKKSREVEKIRTRWQMTNCAAILDIRTAYQHLKSAPMQEVGNRDTLIRFIASSVNLWKPGSTETEKNTSSLSSDLGIWKAQNKDSNLNTLISVVGDELDSYVTMVQSLNIPPGSALPADLPLDERLKRNPLTFWNEHKKEFPNLSKVARSILSIQAISAASERLFSSAGFIGNPHRNRLSDNSLELCTLVKDALKQNIDLKKRMKEIWQRRSEKAKAKRLESRLKHFAPSGKKTKQGDAPVDDLTRRDENESDDGSDFTPGEEGKTQEDMITSEEVRIAKLASSLLAGEADDIEEDVDDNNGDDSNLNDAKGLKPGAKIILEDEEPVKPLELDEHVTETD